MMSELLRKSLILGLLIIGAVAALIYFGQAPTVSLDSVHGTTASSISDLASSYSGVLSRPLLPDFSLGLPLVLQVALSCLLILSMMVVAFFFPRARKVVMLLTFLTTVRHLAWRGMETLDISNPMAAVISITIYAAEVLAFSAMLIGFFQVWSQTEHKSVNLARFPEEQLPSVDVFVCTYNEPVSVLYRSLVGCMSMNYAKKQVYLLDDGNRPEMKELAERVGAHYISRTDNEHAKAGNLNNAMQYSDGELVLVFDADHVPSINFLQEVVGFFIDERLAFVQTPQHFFTTDPFQRNLMANRQINNEQDLFFHVIQPGNDYWGAAFFAGSGAIFRRSALEQIGGFAIETITEDVHTGMRLHRKGWTSIYYNRDLAAGMAQESFADVIKQRLRWARGMTQIFCLENPLLAGGLSLAQRLCYLTGIWYFFHGLPRLVFLIAPLFFLLFGYKTVNAGFVEVLIYYIPSFLATSVGYTIVSRGVRHSFWSEVYETAFCVYLLLTTLLTMISPKRAKFRVTPKGGLTEQLNFNWRIVFPQLVIAALTIVGIGMAFARALYTPEYAGGIYTNMFWSMYNLILLLGAIYVAQERPQFRLAPRIHRRIRCELKLVDGTIAVGYTTNVSESGIALVFDEPIPVTGTVALKVMDWEINETTVLNVQVVRSTIDEDNRHYVGFRVVNRSEEQHQKLVRHMFGSAEVWAEDYIYTRTDRSFWDLITTPFRVSAAFENPMRRAAPRFSATLSCVLNVEGHFIIGFSNEVSETGTSVYVKKEYAQAFQLDQPVRLRIQWPAGQISELDAVVKRVEDADGGQIRVGLHFTNISREQNVDLIKQIYRPREHLIRTAPLVYRMVNGTVRRQNGEQLRIMTQEISEMGLMVRLQGKPNFDAQEKVQVELNWDDDTQDLYQCRVVDAGFEGAVPMAILYFDGLDMKTLDRLSQRMHEPSESRAFQTLIEG